MSLLHLTDKNFQEEVLKSNLTVLVDFWATWCAPCRMLTPVVDELAKEFEGKIKIGKLDVDENPKIPSQYGIMSIPTLIFFKDGKAIEQIVGVLSRHQLKQKIEEHI